MSNYFLLETGKSHIVIYDSIESLLAHIYYYYDECEELIIKKVYKVYDYKRNDLLGTSIFVDTQAKNLLISLNSKFDKAGDININYYIYKKTNNILTGVGQKCNAPCREIWQLTHNL